MATVLIFNTIAYLRPSDYDVVIVAACHDGNTGNSSSLPFGNHWLALFVDANLLILLNFFSIIRKLM